MKKIIVKIDGEEKEVLAQKIQGKVWLHVNGQTYTHSPRSSSSQSSGEVVQDPTKIVAPMPGKIMKVFATKGATVSEGETLIAMEAMKMEYNLKATQNMTVTKLNCTEGQQVSLGEILVEMEE